MVDPNQIAEWNQALDSAHPREVLTFAYETFGSGVTLASSFSMEDVLLIHWATEIQSGVDVFCLDTQLLFPETYRLIQTIQARYSITLRWMVPALTLTEQARRHGEQLWAREPEACCGIRKIEPLRRALNGYDGWITGIRRDQTAVRKAAQRVQWDPKFELVKVNPLVAWSSEEVENEVFRLGLAYNPLHDQGYPSIGCWPCTRPVKPGDDARAGRWAQFEKTECGLHQ